MNTNWYSRRYALDSYQSVCKTMEADEAFLRGLNYWDEDDDRTDKNRAFRFFEKAAALGSDDAKLAIAYSLDTGIGTQCDKKRAIAVYKDLSQSGALESLRRYYAIMPQYAEVPIGKFFGRVSVHGAHFDHMEAVLLLGYSHHFGTGVEKDLEKAATLYRRAAKMGSYQAIDALNELLATLEADRHRHEEIAALLHKVSDMGNTQATYWLGLMYLAGSGVERNYTKAAKLIRLAAKAGIPDAKHTLAMDCYYKGRGVVQDWSAAETLLKEAILSGLIVAKVDLAVLYLQPEWGTKDHSRAVRLLEDAAYANVRFAYSRLGWCYELGIGVKRQTDIAFHLYKKGAKAGDREGIVRLAECYLLGEFVETNTVEAVKLLYKAREQGSLLAEAYLAFCLLHGRGLEQDINTAISMLNDVVATESDDTQRYLAERFLAVCYLIGLGVEIDEDKARSMLEYAAKNRDEVARHILEDLET